MTSSPSAGFWPGRTCPLSWGVSSTAIGAPWKPATSRRWQAQVFEAEWEHVQTEYGRLSFPLTASEVVAVAKIGAYRMVKLAFKGPQWPRRRPTAVATGRRRLAALQRGSGTYRTCRLTR